MSLMGLLGLIIACAAVAVSVVSLAVGRVLYVRKKTEAAETLTWAGCIATIVAALALTFCCAILVFCFMTGDTSIEYVVEQQSKTGGVLGILYKLSGLWGGREGSLLFWAWLISLFNMVIAVRIMKRDHPLDNMALMVAQIVLLAFVSVCLFSESNMPFIVTPDHLFDAEGNLTGAALGLGMNPLLEHWAMVIHPPTLFVGYAGLTIPFAYAIAALIVNDPSDLWVRKCSRYALFSWMFLGIGIGLGAVWAYVVLGWGGYWGWDPVENASLLSWLVALALIHSFTVYRQRGGFRRWSVMCACLAFTFVVVGTFITRSGVVQSVHAFAGDPVSLSLFGGLIAVSALAGMVGLAIRWKSFGGEDIMESMVSKDAAYYFNNVIMITFTLLLCYLTVSSALPEWLPFGGTALTAGTYNAVARPLGIVYCALIAICPLLAWGATNRKKLLQDIKIPALCAGVLFAILMAYFVTTLYPVYTGIMDEGGMQAAELSSEGPSWYYNGLAVVGFAVASLLFMTTLTMIVRGVRRRSHATGKNVVVTFCTLCRTNSSKYGGYIAHFAMSLILIGLIGSSMYVTEKVAYIPYDAQTDTAEALVVDDYELRYSGNTIEEINEGTAMRYTVGFDVYDAGTENQVGHIDPSVQLQLATQQQKLNAGVMSFPLHDLFVVYRGVSMEGDFSMDVRINPLISFVWVGFALLMVGTALAFFGRRRDEVSEE